MPVGLRRSRSASSTRAPRPGPGCRRRAPQRGCRPSNCRRHRPHAGARASSATCGLSRAGPRATSSCRSRAAQDRQDTSRREPDSCRTEFVAADADDRLLRSSGSADRSGGTGGGPIRRRCRAVPGHRTRSPARGRASTLKGRAARLRCIAAAVRAAVRCVRIELGHRPAGSADERTEHDRPAGDPGQRRASGATPGGSPRWSRRGRRPGWGGREEPRGHKFAVAGDEHRDTCPGAVPDDVLDQVFSPGQRAGPERGDPGTPAGQHQDKRRGRCFGPAG